MAGVGFVTVSDRKSAFMGREVAHSTGFPAGALRTATHRATRSAKEGRKVPAPVEKFGEKDPRRALIRAPVAGDLADADSLIETWRAAAVRHKRESIALEDRIALTESAIASGE